MLYPVVDYVDVHVTKPMHSYQYLESYDDLNAFSV